MGSGAAGAVKTVRCATSLAAELLRTIPGVTAVETADALTVLTTSRPEATLREMLALDQQLHSLEVTSPALEDAFLALTSNP
jgi:ABC-2 type transport system ATP-binding protein